jgi:hypothetical protein
MTEPVAPICIACGSPCTRSKGQSLARFRRRQYCSRACQLANVMPPKHKPQAAPRLSKDCLRAVAGCSGQVVQYADESRSGFNARKFCCRECAAAAHRAGATTKTCATCGQQFSFSPEETSCRLHRRRHCSAQCAGKTRAAKLLGQQHSHSGATRRKGHTKPRETQVASEFQNGAIEAAVRKLRRDVRAVVFPASVVGGPPELWVVDGRQMTTEQLLARAARI